MDGLVGSKSWQPLAQCSNPQGDTYSEDQGMQHKVQCAHALPSKREIFTSSLLTRLPTYALQLLAEGNESKLSCLARLSRDDLAAILAQPHPQLLLEAIYQQHQKQQQLSAANETPTQIVNDSDSFGDLDDSPFTRSMQSLSRSSVTLTDSDQLPQPINTRGRTSSSSGCGAGSSTLLPCSSSIIPCNSPVCSPLAAAAAAQSWPCTTGSSSSTRRYRFRSTPVCANCGIKGHTPDSCFTPHCSTCQLWGHADDDCPNAQCWVCGYYGHSFADCPEQQQQLSLSLRMSVNSQPESSVLLPCSSSRALTSYCFTSCNSSNAALVAAGSFLSVASSSRGDDHVFGSSSRGGGSSSSGSDSKIRGPATPGSGSPVHIPPAAAAATAAAAAGSSDQAAALAASGAAAATAASPAVAAAASIRPAAHHSSSSSSRQRKYMFGGHGRGPLVCCNCGAMGHIADKCWTPRCTKCRRYGHSNSACDSACTRCGREHSAPVGRDCQAKCCANCGLWGHRPRNCPSSQCSNCGYYGHLAAQCMACPQCKKHGHTTAKCPVTKLLGLGVYELISNDL